VYFLVVSLIGVVDMYSTLGFVSLGSTPWLAKVCATAIGLILNFSARRFIVFPESPNPDWKAQEVSHRHRENGQMKIRMLTVGLKPPPSKEAEASAK
jgi:putative flippase GtrA